MNGSGKLSQFQVQPLEYLDSRKMERLHQASLEILSEIGCLILHEKARSLLESHGARLEADGRVFIPESLVTKALEQVPPSVTIYNRSGDPAMEVGGVNAYFGTGSDCQYLLDPETGAPREFLYEDVKDAVRIADALPFIDFVMGMGAASDLDLKNAFQCKYAAMLRNTVKPQILISGPEPAVLDDLVLMAEAVAGGEDRLREKPIFLLLVDPTSPLVHTDDAVEKLTFMARNRLPVIYAPGIMAGATGPITMAGAIAQANAEILAGLVIHQLTAPGAPFVFGGGMSPMDMKSCQPTYSAPEAMIAQAGLCQMGRSFYHLPTYGFGGCTASKRFDEQAVNEAATYLMMSAWMGTNLIHDIGYIEFGMTYSLELMVLCNEVAGQIRRMMDGIIVDDEHLAIDAIRQTGPGGSFLTSPHTFAHFRRNWQPDLTDRNIRQMWEKRGRTTMGDRARMKISEIIENYNPSPLPDEADARIEQIIAKAERRPFEYFPAQVIPV